jgi:lactoylglutathione lyase
MTSAIRQLRVVVEAPDYDAAVAFYRDILGMPVEEVYETDDGRVTILGAGRATLELSDPAQVAYIDRVEVGRRVAGHIRIALEVDDARAATRDATDGGAELLAEPTVTPWNSLNARLEGPAGLQLTLFQELG